MSRPGRRAAVRWTVLLVAGLAVAGLVHLFVPDRQELVLDDSRIARAVAWEEDVRGRSLEPEEREALVTRLVDEEILLAEAARLGLHERGYVHQRLVKKMRFLFTEELAVPTDAELKAAYDADPGPFRRPGAVAFRQVFFAKASPSTPPDEAAFLARLEEEADPSGLGEPHALGPRVGLRTYEQLQAELGTLVLEALTEAPLARWSGPLLSAAGTHYVCVTQRRAPSTVPFEEVLPSIRGTWTVARQREAIARRTAELLQAYDVRLEEGE